MKREAGAVPPRRCSVKKFLLLALIAALILVKPAFSQERDVLNLTLEEAIAKALKNNLSVAIDSLSPDLAQQSLLKARETFLPRFELSYGGNRSENPSYWWLQGSGTSISKLRNYGLSVAETIPTGGSLSVSLENYRSETNQTFQLINPRYGSTLRFDFTQPLLRNFGPKMARRQVIAAENNLTAADHQLQGTMIDTIYAVQEAYWNYVHAIENAKVKRQSLELGRDLVAKNKKEVEFGTLAPLEVLNAEATVAQREADLIQAEGLIARSEEVLKTVINLAAETDARAKRIVPSDIPEVGAVMVSLEEALKQAREKRPDLQVLKATIDTKTLNLAVARNQMLPSLDLQFSYWSPGISGDRLLYLEDNPFLGQVIGKVPGSSADSLRDALKFLYNNWNVGLTLSIPTSALTTRADYGYAKADLQQTELRLKQLEQQIALEVSDAVRTIETNRKRLEAYRLATELAQKSLDAEVKKLAVGLSTNYFVLEFQDRLANARSAELRAKIDTILSVERLEKAMATGLEKLGIK
jgi:outer membrane protein TolC